MAKKNLDLHDKYKIAWMLIAFITMTFCFFHFDRSGKIWKLDPIVPGKEWWNLFSYLLFNALTSKLEFKTPPQIIHVVGVILGGMIVFVGVSQYFGYDLGVGFWGVLGCALGLFSGETSNPI